jgi:hypothetical protein
MRTLILSSFVLALGCSCSNPSPGLDSGSDAGVQTARLRIVNGCSDSLWIFYLIGDGGGSLPTSHQTLLASGAHLDYPIPDQGLAATRFWPGYGCDATGNNCRLGQSGGPASQGFVCPSYGCAPPIDSKFEGTFGCLPSVPPNQCWINPSSPTMMRLPTTDSWDTSMVDGFTLPYRVRVLDSCPGGPMNSTIDCSTLPLSVCPTSEDLSTGGMYPALNALNLNASIPGGMLASSGCYSDCGRLTYNQWGETPTFQPMDPQAQMYCCPTPPVQPSACRMGPVASSGYTNLVHRTCPQVYAYAYDDGTGLWSCPAGTRYEVTFYCPQ